MFLKKRNYSVYGLMFTHKILNPIKTLEKAGFKREGLIREGKMVNTYCDYYLYGMIKADYIEISQSKSALREKPGKK